MIIHEGYNNLDLKSPVVTLGIFDGVHRGHRLLLDMLVARAREIHGDSVVITFNPHPRLVLEKNNEGLSLLSTIEEKIALLEVAGIDHLIIIAFTNHFSRITARDFISEVLIHKIGTRFLILGHDHHFGYKGEGNFETVNNCAESMGFRIEQVDGLKYGGNPVSSSGIREALLAGKIDEANNMLGYFYSLKGTVVRGKRLGKKLGFPTANIIPGYRYKLVPADGVYAVNVKVNYILYNGVLSIGKNPTINRNNKTKSVEVNIFGFNEDIYEKEIEIIFRFRLREEKTFDTLEQLSSQISLDKKKAMELLS